MNGQKKDWKKPVSLTSISSWMTVAPLGKNTLPFNRIMVTAAASEVPRELMSQLAIGGKMLIPVGTPLLQELLLLEKVEDGEIHTTVLNEVRFVPLKDKYE